MGFPQGFLIQIYPYLSAHSLSALARTCRSHMMLCYLCAEDIFQWKPDSWQWSGYWSDLYFPADAFLHKQLAKIRWLTSYANESAERLRKKRREDMANFMKDPDNIMNYVGLFGESKIQNTPQFSLSRYYQEAAFVSSATILSTGNFNGTFYWFDKLVPHILAGTPIAKSFLCLVRRDLDGFLKNTFQSNDDFTYFCIRILVNRCKSEDTDMSILPYLVTEDNHDWFYDIVYDNKSCTIYEKFHAIQHPVVYQLYFRDGYFGGILQSILECSKQGYKRLIRLMEINVLKEEDLLAEFKSNKDNILSQTHRWKGRAAKTIKRYIRDEIYAEGRFKQLADLLRIPCTREKTQSIIRELSKYDKKLRTNLMIYQKGVLFGGE